jgi:hypothetical protein
MYILSKFLTIISTQRFVSFWTGARFHSGSSAIILRFSCCKFPLDVFGDLVCSIVKQF